MFGLDGLITGKWTCSSGGLIFNGLFKEHKTCEMIVTGCVFLLQEMKYYCSLSLFALMKPSTNTLGAFQLMAFSFDA